MKCFVLLCIVAVVGVGARPSATVSQPAEDAISSDIGELDTQDITPDDVFNTGLALVKTNPLGRFLDGLATLFRGKKDIEASLSQEDVDKLKDLLADIDTQDITPDDVFKTGLALVKTTPLGRFMDGLVTIFRGKKDIASELDTQDIDPNNVFDVSLALVKTHPLGRFLDGLATLFRGKKDIEAQDFDLDAVLGHIVSIANDVSKNVQALLPTIIKVAGAVAKSKRDDMPVDVQDFDLEDVTGVLAKISKAWTKVVAGVAPIVNQLPLDKLGKRDVPDVDIQDIDLADITGFLEKIFSVEL